MCSYLFFAFFNTYIIILKEVYLMINKNILKNKIDMMTESAGLNNTDTENILTAVG